MTDLASVLVKLRGLSKKYEAQSFDLSGDEQTVTATFVFPNSGAADRFRHRALLEAHQHDVSAFIHERMDGSFGVVVTIISPYSSDHLRFLRGAS